MQSRPICDASSHMRRNNFDALLGYRLSLQHVIILVAYCSLTLVTVVIFQGTRIVIYEPGTRWLITNRQKFVAISSLVEELK